MHTVIETSAYLAAAKSAHMTKAERDLAVETLARDPEAGELMVGAGGCRKVRIAGRGKGKGGGYRVITAFGGGPYPGLPDHGVRQGRKGQPVEGRE